MTRCWRARLRSISARPRTRRAPSPILPTSKRLVALARKHGFLIFSDECYSEIYTREKPPGIFDATGRGFLQRRRVQLAVETVKSSGRARRHRGRRETLHGEVSSTTATSSRRKCRDRCRKCAAAAYSDETHVEENRRLYRLKFDLADQIVGDRYGYTGRPADSFSGSMCQSTAAAKRLP